MNCGCKISSDHKQRQPAEFPASVKNGDVRLKSQSSNADTLIKPREWVNSLMKKKAYHDQLMDGLEVAVQAAITDKLTGETQIQRILHRISLVRD